MVNKGKILVVDDNPGIRAALKILLPKYFAAVELLASPKEIHASLREFVPDVILLDMNFEADTNTGNEGLFWLSEIKQRRPQTEVVLFTAYADIALAVEGMKRGAFDFIVKPWENEKLIATLQAAIDKAEANNGKGGKVGGKGQKKAGEAGPSMLWGTGAAMTTVRRTVEKIAPTDASVLITGENGTGKDVLAAEIHRLSDRGLKPMVCVDAGAITETLFESELFGHVKGAFTDAHTDHTGKMEQANGSTLFLDEIGNLPLGLQAKLLAALQNREVTRLGSNRKIPVDIRLIAATNRNLPEMVAQSLFREDLFYRINTIQIEIPPLRSRREDIALFVDYFLKKYTDLYRRTGLTLHPQALEKLANYDWPGTIRELQHTIEKAVILAEKNVIRASDLFIRPGKALSFSEVPNLEEVERQAILAAITQNEGNLTAAAEQLGVSRQTLYNKMKRFNL